MLSALAMLLFTACQPGKKVEDSSEIAKEHNDEVIDDKDEEKDADFVVNAVAASIAEINLAQLASSKSADNGVKKIAAMLETDHTTVLHSLQGYAATNGISVPSTETNEAKEERNDLAEKAGKDFDKEWCDKVQSSHKKNIRKFESRIDKTEDAGLKNLLSTNLSGLKNHLAMLEQHEEIIK